MGRRQRKKPQDENRQGSGNETNANRLWVFAACGLLIVSTLAVYANSLSGVFVLDDSRCIVENVTLRSWDKTLSPLGYEVPIGLWRRPVVRYSFALNYAMGGTDPWGYHVVNLFIHICTGLLLFDLLRRTFLLDSMPERIRRDSVFLSLAAALLWLVHPLQTESVTYVVQRLELAMGMFFLACLYCVLRGSQSRRSWAWYVGAIAACWLGMGSKEVTIVLPIVALLYDRAFLALSWRTVFIQRWWLYVGFLPAIVWLMYVMSTAPDVTNWVGFLGEGHNWAPTSWEYFRSQPGVILRYLRLVFLPTGQCFYYGWPVANSAIAVVVPGILVALMFAASLLAFRYVPRVGFLGLAFFLILAPTSSVMPIHDLAFEHRMYLPLACVLTLVVLGAYWLFSTLGNRIAGRPRWAIAAVVVVAVALGTCTIARNRLYSSAEMIWRDTVEKAPHCSPAHDNLAKCLLDREDYAGGVEYCKRAIELDPENAFAIYRLGLVMFHLGRHSEAIRLYSDSLRLAPRSPDSYAHLGLAYHACGKFDDAIASYRQALHLRERDPATHFWLGDTLQSQGKLDAAIVSYRRAIQLQPDLAETHNNLGNALRDQGKLDEAFASYVRALDLKPSSAGACNNLANIFQSRGKAAEAIAMYRQALRWDSSLVSAHYNLAAMLAKADPKTAQSHCEKALVIAPHSAIAHCNYATFLQFRKRYAMAIEYYQKALAIDPNLAAAREGLAASQRMSRGISMPENPE